MAVSSQLNGRERQLEHGVRHWHVPVSDQAGARRLVPCPNRLQKSRIMSPEVTMNMAVFRLKDAPVEKKSQRKNNQGKSCNVMCFEVVFYKYLNSAHPSISMQRSACSVVFLHQRGSCCSYHLNQPVQGRKYLFKL